MRTSRATVFYLCLASAALGCAPEPESPTMRTLRLQRHNADDSPQAVLEYARTLTAAIEDGQIEPEEARRFHLPDLKERCRLARGQSEAGEIRQLHYWQGRACYAAEDWHCAASGLAQETEFPGPVMFFGDWPRTGNAMARAERLDELAGLCRRVRSKVNSDRAIYHLMMMCTPHLKNLSWARPGDVDIVHREEQRRGEEEAARRRAEEQELARWSCATECDN